MPVLLFLATCVSTFWAGASNWRPLEMGLNDGIAVRAMILTHGLDGLRYMLCVLAILLTHEMGHFLATVRYRIPASYPYFIPFPASPLGTMGAVIAMQPHRAHRRQIFDIGIAGPLAGLLVALPILGYGIYRLDLQQPGFGGEIYDCPLLVQWLGHYLRPEVGTILRVQTSQLNPYFMAGWVGLLITGLNMLPVSQLDGGHVIYTLFLRRAHWLARAFLIGAILFVVFAEAYIWTLMVILVTFMGTDHPPTANDREPLGWPRLLLGCLSLGIPIICFPPHGVMPVY